MCIFASKMPIKTTMKKILKAITGSTALALSMLISTSASAEVLLSEDFNYPAGNLYGQGGWLQSNNKTNPIQVTTSTLSLDGFASGKSIKLSPVDSQDQDCQKPIVAAKADGTYEGITDGTIYAAMLVNVQNVTDNIYFAAFSTTNTSNLIKDSASFTGPYGATFVMKSETEGKYKIAISKGSGTNVAKAISDKELDYNTTYLLVVKYTAIPGTTNDTFEAWVNPVTGGVEPAAELSAATNLGDPTRGVASICIAQATGSSTKCPEMLVGPIRVATTWAELWSEGGGGDTPDPSTEITATAPRFDSNFALYQYQKYEAKVNIKASGITGDITVGSSSSVKPAVTTIPAAEACRPAGYDLTVTLDASAGTAIAETLSLTSGETSTSVSFNVPVYPVKQMMNFRFVPNLSEWETYFFGGNAVVTFIDASAKKMYLQDVVGGMALSYEYAGLDKAPFNVGDKVTGLYIMATEKVLGIPGCELMGFYVPGGISFGAVTDTDATKQPVELTAADLADDLETYLNRLVKITDVTFSAAGGTFATATTDVTTANGSAKVRAFAGTDLIGTAIPESATAVIGISTSATTPIISMRGSADLIATPAGEETLEVTPEMLVDASEYYPVGVATPFAKFTVKAQNLARPADIYVTGTDRAQFSADLEQIPAGTGEYVITVTMNATKVGRLQANLLIDTSNTELCYNKSFAGLAYDPDNLPTFSIDASGLTAFTAKAGETQDQTVTINATGLLDYGTIRVLGQGMGSFRIASTSFLKNGTTQLRITFAPSAAGNYSETIEFSSPKAETKTLVVTGTATAGTPVTDKEGDELTYDTSNPLRYYATDFSGSGAKNKPLALDGWKNVAVDGNRAWWSYTDANDDDNQCAKVTSYIWGGATYDEPSAEMLLLSPALDYAGCTHRLLSFRIKGEQLSDGQLGQLSVLYIDPELPESERYQVLLGGSDIPTGQDASGEWREYVIDLEGLDLADTFFIGFHYLSYAGANSPESYYVDDFSYGDTTRPFIRIDKQQVSTVGKVGETTPLETITVTGLNLSEPIKVSLEGAHKAMFHGHAEELPAAGGELNFKYSPTDLGEHAVYVNLSSAGAPTTQLVIGGRADEVTGIALPGVEANARVAAYDLNGRRVVTDSSAADALQALRTLDRGVYILQVNSPSGETKSVKYLRP